MSENKTALPSLRNQGWKTIKAKTEKINDLLTTIPTNITELIDLIYAGAKLVREKIGVPLKNTKKKSKPGREIRLETPVRKLQQTKMLKELKSMRLCSGNSEKKARRL